MKGLPGAGQGAQRLRLAGVGVRSSGVFPRSGGKLALGPRALLLALRCAVAGVLSGEGAAFPLPPPTPPGIWVRTYGAVVWV